jgi:hypothetical protein
VNISFGKKMASLTIKKVGYLMIAAVVLFVSVYYITDYYFTADRLADHQTCKTSVLAHANMKMLYADFSEAIKCPTRDIDIKTKDKDEIMFSLAEEMAQCWNVYGQGKLELFDLEPNFDTTYCGICSHVRFDTDKDIELVEFMEYLADKEYRGETSYLEFLSAETTSNMPDFDQYGEEITPVIDTTEDYGVFLIYTKEEYQSRFWSTIWGIGAGVAGGVVAVVGIILSPISLGITGGAGIVAGGALIGASAGYLLGDNTKDWFSYVALYPFDEPYIEELHCDILPIEGGKE